MTLTKDNLKRLLPYISKIIENPSNEWFKNELLRSLALEKNQIVGDQRIKEIYELCVRKIIYAQAEDFYKTFPIEEIKQILIKDFVRADTFKRNNEFIDFALAVHQQIENIVITLFQQVKLREFVSNNAERAIFRQDLEKPYYEGDHNVKGLVSFKTLEFPTWTYKQKLKLIIFYYYFNKVIPNYDEFNKVFNELNKIYIIRNESHRGTNEINNKYTEDILASILESYNRHYFKFLGILEDFVTRISPNIK